MKRLAAIALLVSTRAWGFGAGISGYSGLNKDASGNVMNCNNCHSGGPPPTSVTISGPATLEVGTQATYTLDVVTGASSACVGFDIGASDGKLGVISTQANQSYLIDPPGEITHTKMWPTGATVQLQFTFTAPAQAEMVTLKAWALRSDCADDEAGDSGAGGKLAVNVIEPAAPPPDFAGTTLDLAGVDFSEPEIPDLSSSVDAISSATAQMTPDMGKLPPRDEPTWACNCQLGGHAPVPVPALALLVLALLSIRRARRR